MLVTLSEHAAPDLCIFNIRETERFAVDRAECCGFVGAISGLFTERYEFRAGLWYLKC